jgi:hypothetical protein
MVAGHVLVFAICLWTVERASGGDPVTIRVIDPQGVAREPSAFQTAMTSGRVRLRATFLRARWPLIPL